MATSEPLTGVTVQDQSDAATGGTQIGNLAKAIAKFTVPRFASTGARDTAYTAFVTAGGAMADGMVCMANGVPYRRIAGTWRVSHQRMFTRLVVPTTGSVANLIPSGGSAETGLTTGAAALASFTLWEAGVIGVNATFRAGGAGAALCAVKIDGTQVGTTGVTRTDVTTTTIGLISLAAGTHSVSARVDASGGATTWTETSIRLDEGATE